MKHLKTQIATYLFLALALACKTGGDPAQESPENPESANLIAVSAEQFRLNGMALSPLQKRSFPETLQVSGTIDVPPENRAVVSAIRGGFVRDIKLLVGDQVQKGQRIALLESPEYLELQQMYLETQAELPSLEAEFRRQKTLFDENISSEKVFLQAQSAFKSAQARNANLKRQLALLNIPLPDAASGELRSHSPVRAPIAGHITKVSVRKGAYVSQAGEIVEIVNRDHLHLELKVYEKDVRKLEVGQPIRFKVPELSDAIYEASIHLIGTSVGPDRTVQVHAHLADETEKDFLVGMFVRAEVLLETSAASPEVWAAPEGAVVQQGNAHFILILEEEGEDGFRLRKVEVSPGRTSGGLTELQGLENADASKKVLSAGAFSLVGS